MYRPRHPRQRYRPAHDHRLRGIGESRDPGTSGPACARVCTNGGQSFAADRLGHLSRDALRGRCCRQFRNDPLNVYSVDFRQPFLQFGCRRYVDEHHRQSLDPESGGAAFDGVQHQHRGWRRGRWRRRGCLRRAWLQRVLGVEPTRYRAPDRTGVRAGVRRGRPRRARRDARTRRVDAHVRQRHRRSAAADPRHRRPGLVLRRRFHSGDAQRLQYRQSGSRCRSDCVYPIPQFAVTTPSAGYPVVVSPDFCFPFQVTFTPAAAGLRTAKLTIPTNDPVNACATVEVRATGTVPDIRVTGSTAFGVVSAWSAGEKNDLGLQHRWLLAQRDVGDSELH